MPKFAKGQQVIAGAPQNPVVAEILDVFEIAGQVLYSIMIQNPVVRTVAESLLTGAATPGPATPSTPAPAGSTASINPL